MRTCVVQLNNTADKAENLNRIGDLIDAAVQADHPDFIVLPEMSACMTTDEATLRASAEPIDGPFLQALSGLARHYSVNLLSGSTVEQRGDRLFNTSVLFGRTGQTISQYSKIHRFDVSLPDGTAYHESQIVERGDEVVSTMLEGVRVGFTICYDLRFPVMFHKLAEQGCDLIVLPAAFTFQTGAAHWEVLLRARAIETQCYVLAAGQTGALKGEPHMSFGHSMIVDPWGQIVAQVSNKPGHAAAQFDREYLQNVRQRMPVRQHQILS
ncbi:MAG: hypothetical protein JWR80_6667 [Bradyrhizobium sp.]|nr:hypothetical protein [Bradyrhizobium sp.]